MTLRAALIESNNAAAADLQQEVGTRTVLRLAGDAGLNDLPEVASLALGTGLVSPLDLTAAYIDLSVRRRSGAAARHSQRLRCIGQPGARSTDRAPAAPPGTGGVSNDQHAARRHRTRHRRIGADARRAWRRRRQDRDN
jgi:hypothetical protein